MAHAQDVQHRVVHFAHERFLVEQPQLLDGRDAPPAELLTAAKPKGNADGRFLRFTPVCDSCNRSAKTQAVIDRIP